MLATLEIGSLIALSVLGTSLTKVGDRRDQVSGMQIERSGLQLRSMPPGQPVELHPYFGFTSTPVQSSLPQESELARLGFPYNRHDELFYEASPERVVVGVFGGSVARIAAVGGAGLELVLNRVHRFAGKEIIVLSFADGGFKQPQQLMILNYLLAMDAHFDVVINLDGFNEVALGAENQSRGISLHYPRGWDNLAASPDPQQIAASGRLIRSKAQRHRFATFAGRYALEKSPTVNALWLALDHWLESRMEIDQQILSAVTDTDNASKVQPTTTGDSGLEELVTTWRRASKLMSDLCELRGIEYHHFLQPNQYFPETKPLAEEVARGFYLENHPYANAARRSYLFLLEAGHGLKNQGVNFHDLSRIFVETQEAIYSDSCCHLDFVGNLRLEESIAVALAKKGSSSVGNVTDEGLAVAGYDPISYFDGQPVLGTREWASTVDGTTYWHKNEANRQRFLIDPNQYLPQFGGWCAFGLGMDEEEIGYPRGRYPVDPEHYRVIDNKLYLFFRSPTFDAREAALKDWETVIMAAREAWNQQQLEHD